MNESELVEEPVITGETDETKTEESPKPILPLVFYPDPILRRICEPVASIQEAQKIIHELKCTLLAQVGGFGLAAPQIGILKDVFIVKDKQSIHSFVNCKVVDHSKEMASFKEGCLSLPGYFEYVSRWKAIVVEYQDESGETKTLAAKDSVSACILHEMDHTCGRLFIDQLSKLKRDLFERWLKKRANALWKSGHGFLIN